MTAEGGPPATGDLGGGPTAGAGPRASREARYDAAVERGGSGGTTALAGPHGAAAAPTVDDPARPREAPNGAAGGTTAPAAAGGSREAPGIASGRAPAAPEALVSGAASPAPADTAVRSPEAASSAPAGPAGLQALREAPGDAPARSGGAASTRRGPGGLPGRAVEAPQPGRGSMREKPPARPIEGLLLGLAAGDAAGWPAARHRAARMPEWTRRLTRELDTFAEQNATTTLPVPIALNQPPEPLRLGPSDDAEWAAFAAETVLTAAGDLFAGLAPGRRMRAAVDLAWNSLASEVAAAADRAPEVESAVLPLRARISVRAGLGNLATGLRPPATGHDNPHYFDDAACVRAAVLAVVHPGDPAAAAELAEFDARYSQDGDGVHGARAMAAAVAAALGGASVDAAVDAALAELPDATEIGRNAHHAVKLARHSTGAFELVPLLEHQIVDHVYSYGIAAAETVPVALALAVAARGRVAEAVPAAACLSRVADSAPALAGALTGALGGGDSVPATWRDACRTLAGCALPRLAGTDLVELAGLLAHTELTTPGGQFRHDDDTRDAHTR